MHQPHRHDGSDVMDTNYRILDYTYWRREKEREERGRKEEKSR